LMPASCRCPARWSRSCSVIGGSPCVIAGEAYQVPRAARAGGLQRSPERPGTARRARRPYGVARAAWTGAPPPFRRGAGWTERGDGPLMPGAGAPGRPITRASNDDAEHDRDGRRVSDMSIQDRLAAGAATWCAQLTCKPLSEDEAAEIAPLFKALADPVRLRLLSLIASHEGGEVCVCDLTVAFDVTPPTISHHLKVLRQAGLIEGG